MPKMAKQVEKILGTSSTNIIQALLAAGESLSTIREATGMSSSQVSLVGNGKRTLGEHYYRELVKLAIARGIF
jgi:DNA-binding transcriptional regulator GbsR (MarR family)